MTESKQVSFEDYLEIMFSTSNWIEGVMSMLGAFCEDVQLCEKQPGELAGVAPSIIDQTAALLDRGRRLSDALRDRVDERPELFRASEVTAATWWADMAAFKANGNLELLRQDMANEAWEDVLFELHAFLYETVSCLSLTDVAQRMLRSTEADSLTLARPN